MIVSLCFTEDPEEVIAEVTRVLKPDGEVIIGMVDRKSFLGKFIETKEVFFTAAPVFSVLMRLSKCSDQRAFPIFSFIKPYLNIPTN